MTRLLRAYGDVAVGITAAAVGIVIVAVSETTEGPLWANVLAMLALGGLLAARGRAPVATAYGFLVVLSVMTFALISPSRAVVVFFGLLLFSYSAGSSRRPALAWWFMPLLLIAVTTVNLRTDSTFSDYVFPAAISLAAYGAGRNQLVRGALAVELHDVVAHSISVMVVQAGGARRIIERDPERASAAAASIEQTGRDTLLEMRRLLGVMHPGAAPADLEPSPTLRLPRRPRGPGRRAPGHARRARARHGRVDAAGAVHPRGRRPPLLRPSPRRGARARGRVRGHRQHRAARRRHRLGRAPARSPLPAAHFDPGLTSYKEPS